MSGRQLALLTDRQEAARATIEVCRRLLVRERGGVLHLKSPACQIGEWVNQGDSLIGGFAGAVVTNLLREGWCR